MEITITIPDSQMSALRHIQKDLQDRGFSSRESEVWAAIYCREIATRVEETSEKVIEMFGVNLLHSMENIKHFAETLKKSGNAHKLKLLMKELSQTA